MPPLLLAPAVIDVGKLFDHERSARSHGDDQSTFPQDVQRPADRVGADAVFLRQDQLTRQARPCGELAGPGDWRS